MGGHQVRKETDTAEITRLAIDPAITDRGLSSRLMKTIFKGMYQWCLLHEVRYTYMVVEHRLLRVVQRMGWPCKALGEPVALPPAEVFSIGGVLDLEEFRSQASVSRSAMLDWLTTTAPTLGPAYAQQPTQGQKSEMEAYAKLAEGRLSSYAT